MNEATVQDLVQKITGLGEVRLKKIEQREQMLTQKAAYQAELLRIQGQIELMDARIQGTKNEMTEVNAQLADYKSWLSLNGIKLKEGK